MEEMLEQLLEECHPYTKQGHVATYIPELGKGDQTYTISYGKEEESMTLNLQQEEPGWISLGNFYLPQGTTTITLTDKVSGDYVIADAVKFTKTN